MYAARVYDGVCRAVYGARLSVCLSVSLSARPPVCPYLTDPLSLPADSELVLLDQWGGLSVLDARNLSTTVLISNQTLKRLNPSKIHVSPDHKYVLLGYNVQKLFRYSFLAQYTIYDIATGDLVPLSPVETPPPPPPARAAPGPLGPAGPPGPPGSGLVPGPPFLLDAAWAGRGSALLMVYDYDIYYKPSANASRSYRITNTAVPGVICNGVPDWLYEEEILRGRTAMWMSEDGNSVLFASFNDTLVEEMKIPWYGTVDEDRQYTDIRSLRYPKPGTPNPIVTLRVANLTVPSDIRTRDLEPPLAFGFNRDYYLSAATWLSATEVSVVWMNRPQNLSIISICKSPTWACVETQRVSNEGRGWVDAQPPPLFAPDGNNYVTMAPVRDGAAGFYRHIVHVNITRKRVVPLTHGKFEVARILVWDHQHQQVYYLGVPEGRPGQLHLYVVSSAALGQGEAAPLPRCLTCTPEAGESSAAGSSYYSQAATDTARTEDSGQDDWDDGEHSTEPPVTTQQPGRKKEKPAAAPPVEEILIRPCLYHNAVFSPRLTYFVLECKGPGIPNARLYKTRGVHNHTTPTYGQGHGQAHGQGHSQGHGQGHGHGHGHGQHGQGPAAPEVPEVGPVLVTTLQNNTRLQELASRMALPQVKTFPVQISGGYYAQVRLHLPPGLREEEITRYPLVVQVYGGPGTQLVTDKWRIDWSTYLASNRDFIVAQIDGRGSGGQGYKMMHEVYQQLGTVEVNDQLEVTEYLRDTLHFVDKRRVGVWGWSYGGFVSAMLLAKEQDVFRCGVSVAPVTSWKLYDSAYAERYMGVPNVTGNYKGYNDADLTRRGDGFRGSDKMFYLVHGSADDNVHFQHSMMLSRALTASGVLFRQQIYPDENHSLFGVKRHLYRSMANFLDDCFRKLVPPERKAGLRNGGAPGEQ
ncbi:hypothetical protein ONE63_008469 [Megalurothrips usitatus]|uniref:Venom dipeptidyl peptidase 4 n=1 Tax=Megalurothrips usitatus TaxID=439358 RepID=A0AAV7XTW3_9NEOP|nr:hypothetical protein ONE63_008469 [Megalurothrips usitatus]